MESKKSWSKLDNAAKIFPSATDKIDPKVFRFSCELYEEIDKDDLQKALDKTILKFPNMKMVMKKGAFWYYLEESDIKPKVTIESKAPCSSIYDRNKRKLLFEVTYYNKRINLEIYHVLTDGTGAIEFLKELIINYLVLRKALELNHIPETNFDSSKYQKKDDSFQKYYDKRFKQKAKLKSAYQIKGTKFINNINIIEGRMSVKEVLEKAHNYNATITGFIAGIIVKSIYDEMTVADKRKPIILSVPVNLRKYFDSSSIRNFFGLLNIEYKFEKEPTLDEVIKYTDKCLKEQLKKDKLKERMNTLISVERNFVIRCVPLFIKNIVLKIASNIAQGGETTSLSNVGSIVMPDEIKKYIRLFDMMVSTNKTQACMCSYEDNLVLNFSSVYDNAELQRRVFRTLSTMGISIEIATNN